MSKKYEHFSPIVKEWRPCASPSNCRFETREQQPSSVSSEQHYAEEASKSGNDSIPSFVRKKEPAPGSQADRAERHAGGKPRPA